MNPVINAQGLNKSYGDFKVLDNINLNILPGKIVGLIGPNGAGKTTALRCLLGMANFQGELNVLGKNPQNDRIDMLKDVAFIADTAILPSWIRVDQAIEYMAGVHPKFDRIKALKFIEKTDIKLNSKVKTLSKGMITQLHLALVISIDAKLLVLDEPTLGLDIIYRKQFYEQLLNDYFDEQKTILITTHQVEEIESLLTDLIFIQKGKIVLDMSMEQVSEEFFELEVYGENIQKAQALNPFSERSILGGSAMIFSTSSGETIKKTLSELGKIKPISIADLFVAKMS